MPFGIDSDELKKMQDPEDNPGTFASAKRASDEMPRLYGLTDALIEENAKLKAEHTRLKAEVNIARERLGPAGYKILEKYLSLQAVAKAARSVLSEEGVKEYLSAYVQGCKLIEALDAEKARGEVRGGGYETSIKLTVDAEKRDEYLANIKLLLDVERGEG
jgi:hypothetical protein